MKTLAACALLLVLPACGLVSPVGSAGPLPPEQICEVYSDAEVEEALGGQFTKEYNAPIWPTGCIAHGAEREMYWGLSTLPPEERINPSSTVLEGSGCPGRAYTSGGVLINGVVCDLENGHTFMVDKRVAGMTGQELDGDVMGEVVDLYEKGLERIL